VVHVNVHAPALHDHCALAGSVPLQAAQLPPQQIELDPHDVPSVTLETEPHVCVPVEHELVPTWHVFPPGLHDTPAVHATHVPPLQTMLVPHDVPSATVVVGLQTAVPVEHAVTPFLHALPLGLQGWLAVHAPH
jgi:hypothetical protein